MVENNNSEKQNNHGWPRIGMRPAVLVGLFIVLVFVFLLNLALGSVTIPLDEVAKILLGGEATKSTWERIVLVVRLPGAYTAALAGAALAVSGLQMQTFFRNPLAGPFVIGISSGASLGVAIVVLGGGGTLLSVNGLQGDLGVAAAASAGSALVMLLVLTVARRVQSNMTLLILGVMFGYATGAIVSMLMYFSRPDEVNAYVNWTFGSFGGVAWGSMRVYAPIIIFALLMAFVLAKPLNALLLGESYAISMGLNVKRARIWIIIGTALLAGTVTAFCGPISFVGLAVPHLCRSLFNTSDHRILVPATIVMGAIVALSADLIAQAPGYQNVTLPLNAVTALIGAPVIIWVILSRRNLQQSFAS
jgi:iron complex transport system permease protein